MDVQLRPVKNAMLSPLVSKGKKEIEKTVRRTMPL